MGKYKRNSIEQKDARKVIATKPHWMRVISVVLLLHEDFSLQQLSHQLSWYFSKCFAAALTKAHLGIFLPFYVIINHDTGNSKLIILTKDRYFELLTYTKPAKTIWENLLQRKRWLIVSVMWLGLANLDESRSNSNAELAAASECMRSFVVFVFLCISANV